MKLELKENMYVRTKGGKIDKILKLNKSYVKGVSQKDELYAYDIDNIVKASYNIIDILEEGDYVNGYPVYEIVEYEDNTRAIVIADDNKSIIWEESYQYIKSIVTKEQFSSMEYRLGDDK